MMNDYYVNIKIDHLGAEIDYNGEALLLLKGLAEATVDIINAMPEELQQSSRVYFMNKLNLAIKGELSIDADSE